MPALLRNMGNTVTPLRSLNTTRVWRLRTAPAAAIEESTFEIGTEELPPLQRDEVLVQTTFLSNDPSQRSYIQKDADAARTYAPPVREGSVMAAYGTAKVLASKSDKWKIGDTVIAPTGWREHAVLSADKVKPVIQLPGHSPTLALGILGLPGLTAWHGLHDVGQVKPEHTVLVSGAAGSTGSAAIQIAKKIIGVKRVIGIAGGPTKCAWVEKIGADVCLDYRAPDFHSRLIDETEGFVDVYLDLVGGELLNKVLVRMKRWGKIAAVGSVSAYNDPSVSHLTNWLEVIANRLTITGFIVYDFAQQWPGTVCRLAREIREGTIIVDGSETICEVGFEKIPDVWRGLFTGINQGKLVTKLV